MHKMLDRYFSDKINKFLSIGLKIYGSSDINEILKVVEYEDIIVRDTSVRWMDFKKPGIGAKIQRIMYPII